MEFWDVDRELISWVESEINTGVKQIVVPEYLLKKASKSALREIRRLCRSSCATIQIIA